MRFLRRLFGSGNSIILSYDHITAEGQDDFENQLKEVRAYYEMVSLENLVGSLAPGGNDGKAVIVFQNARKSVLLRAVPLCLSENVPFTIFLRPDCIGLNRLPPEEELENYQAAYPQRFEGSSMTEFQARAWEDPLEAEAYLRSLRQDAGPLPVEKLDPMRFFGTWGELTKLPPAIADLGLSLPFSPRHPEAKASLQFIGKQLGRDAKLAFCARECDVSDLRSLGLVGAVVPIPGAVSRRSNPYALPIWRLVEEKTQSNV